MRKPHHQRHGRGWILFAGLLVAVLAVRAEAKGPAPKPDFVIEWQDHGIYYNYGFIDFEMTGLLEDTGSVALIDSWTDESGTEWGLYHFGVWGAGYFETVLPASPADRGEYEFVLKAGPNGYDNGEVFLGDWAVGVATVRIHRRTTWFSDLYTGELVKVHYDALYWKLNCYLLP